jgi:hypothetical protein
LGIRIFFKHSDENLIWVRNGEYLLDVEWTKAKHPGYNEHVFRFQGAGERAEHGFKVPGRDF